MNDIALPLSDPLPRPFSPHSVDWMAKLYPVI